jgi:hypothetical protein
MTRWRRVACWISKATCAQAYTCAYASTPTHTYARTHARRMVIVIAFPRHQWFCECASVLRYTYIAGAVLCGNV